MSGSSSPASLEAADIPTLTSLEDLGADSPLRADFATYLTKMGIAFSNLSPETWQGEEEALSAAREATETVLGLLQSHGWNRDPAIRIPSRVRWAVRTDMPQILDIESQNPNAFIESQILDLMRQRNTIGMVADRNDHTIKQDRVVGLMIYEVHKAHINLITFGVSPNEAQHGTAEQLCGKMLSKLTAHRRTRLCNVVEKMHENAIHWVQHALRDIAHAQNADELQERRSSLALILQRSSSPFVTNALRAFLAPLFVDRKQDDVQACARQMHESISILERCAEKLEDPLSELPKSVSATRNLGAKERSLLSSVVPPLSFVDRQAERRGQAVPIPFGSQWIVAENNQGNALGYAAFSRGVTGLAVHRFTMTSDANVKGVTHALCARILQEAADAGLIRISVQSEVSQTAFSRDGVPRLAFLLGQMAIQKNMPLDKGPDFRRELRQHLDALPNSSLAVHIRELLTPLLNQESTMSEVKRASATLNALLMMVRHVHVLPLSENIEGKAFRMHARALENQEVLLVDRMLEPLPRKILTADERAEKNVRWTMVENNGVPAAIAEFQTNAGRKVLQVNRISVFPNEEDAQSAAFAELTASLLATMKGDGSVGLEFVIPAAKVAVQ